MLVGLAFAVAIGTAIFWIQASMTVSLVSMGVGARAFQTSLTSAVDQISAGDYEAAKADFDEVELAAGRINSSAFGPKFALLGAIPGVNVAIDNWRLLVSATENITTSTGELLDIYGDLSGQGSGPKLFQDGAIDVDKLKALPPRVAAVDAGVQQTALDMQAINATGPGAQLLGTVRDRALKEIVPVQEAIDALVGLAPLLPDALGANGPKRYLVAIGNQAEMRASGGAPLTLVLVEFNDGRISIPIKGQTSTQLFPPLNAPVNWWGPSMNPFFADNPRNAPMVVANTHPSMLFSAREMAGAWLGGGYPQVDGVVLMDLTAIGAALNAIGPIESEAYGLVTGDQLGQILLVDAYAQFGQTEAEARQQANQKLLDDLLVKLLSGEDLVSVAKGVAGTAPGRHFQVWMRDPEFESFAVRSGAGGEVADPKTGDWSAAYTQNGNQSKVDVFQQRTVVVTAKVNEDGSARVTQQLNLTNATPPERPAEGTFGRIGYETTWLKAAYIMYVPTEATNYSANYPQGFAVRPFKRHQQMGRGFADDGTGQKLIRIVGWTPPGGQTIVSVSYDLAPGTFTTEDGGLAYELVAEPQALFTPSTLTVRVTGPEGWSPVQDQGMQVSGSTAEVSAVQDRRVTVRVDFAKDAA